MKSHFNQQVAILLLGLISLTAPISSASHPPAVTSFPGQVWARTELYFGTDKPGGEVTAEEFKRFVDIEVTPRFPNGLTVLRGTGQFRSMDGSIVQERSVVVVLFYPLRTAGANKRIEEIREQYKRTFLQGSVLRVDALASVSF